MYAQQYNIALKFLLIIYHHFLYSVSLYYSQSAFLAFTGIISLKGTVTWTDAEHWIPTKKNSLTDWLLYKR